LGNENKYNKIKGFQFSHKLPNNLGTSRSKADFCWDFISKYRILGFDFKALFSSANNIIINNGPFSTF